MMKRLFFLLTALLTLSVGMWAQTPYIDENGVAQTVYSVNVITNLTTTLSSGWYVVLGNDVRTGTLTCQGGVHLILADGAKLTTGNTSFNAAGIQVSGDFNYLIIYGQTNQTGQLIATGGGYDAPTGGSGSAGIGGGNGGSGSNITINGGIVTANGFLYSAGIGGGFSGSGSNITINGGIVTANGGQYAAGIGGGFSGSGSNITINGGIVTANGGQYAVGIGRGWNGSSSNIKVNADCHVFADNSTPPTTEIQHGSDDDIASQLNVRYAVIEIDQTLLSELRNEAIATIDEAIKGVADDDIIAIAQRAKNSINNANGRTIITGIKDAALAVLETAVRWYNSGKAEAFGPLGTEQPGPAVKVTKGDTEVILYLPDKVEYIIRK